MTQHCTPDCARCDAAAVRYNAKTREYYCLRHALEVEREVERVTK